MPTVSNLSTTRAELLMHKKQIQLTRQGYNLLDKKRMALLRELVRLEDDVVEQVEKLHNAAVLGRQALASVIARQGLPALRSATMGKQKTVSFEISTRNVMGVKLPYITLNNPPEDQTSFQNMEFNESARIKDVTVSFNAQVKEIIRLAEGEIQFTHLLQEIQNTTRRLKAIENVVLPRLEAELKYIRMALDERERADHNRLKMAKNILESRHVKTLIE